MSEREELANRIDGVLGEGLIPVLIVSELRLIVEALRTPAITDEMVAALENARAEIVVAISFLQRDCFTIRLQKTVEGVIKRLVAADIAARAAFAVKSSPAPVEGSLPSGESNPSVMPDFGAGGTPEYEAAKIPGVMVDKLCRKTGFNASCRYLVNDIDGGECESRTVSGRRFDTQVSPGPILCSGLVGPIKRSPAPAPTGDAPTGERLPASEAMGHSGAGEASIGRRRP